VQNALNHAQTPTGWEPRLMSLKREHLGAADAALAVLRGTISEEEGAKIAAISGLNTADFGTLIFNTGEPPGLEEMLEAYRRKIIDKTRLEKGIRQSRVRDEWSDVVEALRFSPASPADAIRGAVQNHLPADKAKQIFEEGGIRGDDWQWMLESAGNPPGTMQMISLLRRGKAPQKVVEEAIRESHVKDKYIPYILDLKRVIPSIFQINKLLSTGSLSETEGARLLHEAGYEKDIVGPLVHSAVSGAVVKDKELAKAEISELYYDGAVSEAEALKLLLGLGYHESNAKLVLRIVELKREKTLRQAAMSPIKTEYVARRIDKAEAETRLNGLAIPHTQVQYALAAWTIDRDAHTRVLTEAQIVKANTIGLLDDAATEAKLIAIGYHRDDARILLDSEKGRVKPAP
ncbi:MAG: hypothetical protein ACRDK2_02160, partial [Solirubrobacteraceae bacterium]